MKVFRGYNNTIGPISHYDWIYVTPDINQAKWYATKDGDIKDGAIIEYEMDDDLTFLSLRDVNDIMLNYGEKYTIDDLLWYQEGLSDYLCNSGDGIKFEDPYYKGHMIYILFGKEYLKYPRILNKEEFNNIQLDENVIKDKSNILINPTRNELLKNNLIYTRYCFDKNDNYYFADDFDYTHNDIKLKLKKYGIEVSDDMGFYNAEENCFYIRFYFNNEEEKQYYLDREIDVLNKKPKLKQLFGNFNVNIFSGERPQLDENVIKSRQGVEFVAYHGSKEPNMTPRENYPLYLCDDYDLALAFAKGEVQNDGLYDDEIPTIFTFKGRFDKPYYMPEDQYDIEGQDSNIDYEKWVDDGYDGIIVQSEGISKYYIVLDTSKIKLVDKKEFPEYSNNYEDEEEFLTENDEIYSDDVDITDKEPELGDSLKFQIKNYLFEIEHLKDEEDMGGEEYYETYIYTKFYRPDSTDFFWNIIGSRIERSWEGCLRYIETFKKAHNLPIITTPDETGAEYTDLNENVNNLLTENDEIYNNIDITNKEPELWDTLKFIIKNYLFEIEHLKDEDENGKEYYVIYTYKKSRRPYEDNFYWRVESGISFNTWDECLSWVDDFKIEHNLMYVVPDETGAEYTDLNESIVYGEMVDDEMMVILHNPTRKELKNNGLDDECRIVKDENGGYYFASSEYTYEQIENKLKSLNLPYIETFGEFYYYQDNLFATRDDWNTKEEYEEYKRSWYNLLKSMPYIVKNFGNFKVEIFKSEYLNESVKPLEIKNSPKIYEVNSLNDIKGLLNKFKFGARGIMNNNTGHIFICDNDELIHHHLAMIVNKNMEPIETYSKFAFYNDYDKALDSEYANGGLWGYDWELYSDDDLYVWMCENDLSGTALQLTANMDYIEPPEEKIQNWMPLNEGVPEELDESKNINTRKNPIYVSDLFEDVLLTMKTRNLKTIKVVYDESIKKYIYGETKYFVHWSLILHALENGLYPNADKIENLANYSIYHSNKCDCFAISVLPKEHSLIEDDLYPSKTINMYNMSFYIYNNKKEYIKKLNEELIHAEMSNWDDDIMAVVLKNPTKKELSDNKLNTSRFICFGDTWLFFDTMQWIHENIYDKYRSKFSELSNMGFYDLEENEFIFIESLENDNDKEEIKYYTNKSRKWLLNQPYIVNTFGKDFKIRICGEWVDNP